MTNANHRRERKRVAALFVLLLVLFVGVLFFANWLYFQPQTANSNSDAETLLDGNGNRVSLRGNIGGDNANRPRGNEVDPVCGGKVTPPTNEEPVNPDNPQNYDSRDIWVDFKVGLPQVSGAIGWGEILVTGSRCQIVVVGGSHDLAGDGDPLPDEVKDGHALYSKMFRVRTTGKALAIAVIAILTPVSADGVPMKGEIACFAAHKILSAKDAAQISRIVLDQTAPTRDITLLFDAKAAGATFSFNLININEASWLRRPEALRVEPNMWPSEGAKEFRRELPGEECTNFSELSLSALGLVGDDGTVKFWNLPLGFGLPTSISLTRSDDFTSLGNCFLSNSGGTMIENRYKNRRAVLPRDGDSLPYLRTGDDFLPQINLVGSLVKSKSTWPKFTVYCRLPSNEVRQPEGFDIAQARYSVLEGRWTWEVKPRPELDQFLRTRVYYTLEEPGTARTVVEGLLSPEPEITLSVEPPTKPWTLRATMVAGDDTPFPLPVRIAYSFGNNRSSVAEMRSATDDSGSWTLSGIEGPISDEMLGDASFSVQVDEQALKKVLCEIYQLKTGVWVDWDVMVNPDGAKSMASRTQGNPADRTLELRWHFFYITVGRSGEKPIKFKEFINKNELSEEYASAIKKIILKD